MAWRSILPGHGIPDPRRDARTAESFGAFRISDEAVYLSGREYLPLDAVQRARLYVSRLDAHGCCGLGLPVWYVLVYYGGEAPLKLMSETREKAERALARLVSGRPGIEIAEPNVTP